MFPGTTARGQADARQHGRNGAERDVSRRAFDAKNPCGEKEPASSAAVLNIDLLQTSASGPILSRPDSGLRTGRTEGAPPSLPPCAAPLAPR
ncbi:hypothetical protein SKAU_G00429590 [Synaphobranchus kaupii]|uniref:Uncharacterized protein n=1 Tax=Synaphobranchus kaupii TaxID=118154 RepID=A0A9Q1E4E8_SYNKA|nr:hypothetical protein SKAU_G00429590 [Synaphobranchus kaupii]